MSHLAPTSTSCSQREAALQTRMLVRTLGPGFGIEPKRALAFLGMLILPLSLGLGAIPEDLGGKSRAGHI